jgi:hypothetical protein
LDNGKTMNIKQKLTNPFALVAQGFGVGAIFFFAAMALEPDLPPQVDPAQTASASTGRPA